MRSCGECTECCQGWLKDDNLNLKPGSPCVHCTQSGCGIYDTRPENPCRTFRCGWLTHENDFPDDMRPDRCGAIILLDRDYYSWKMVRAIPTGERIPEETYNFLLEHAKSKQLPFSFLERELVDGEEVLASDKALGPPAFTQEVKHRMQTEPSQADVFWAFSGDN